MAWDPRIIMGFQPSQVGPDPREMMQTLAQMAQTRQHQQQQQQAATLADIYRQTAGSPDSTAEMLQRGGFGAQAMDWRAGQSQQATRDATHKKLSADLLETARQHLRNQAAAVKTPEQYAQLIQGASPEFLQSVGLSEQFDPSGLEMFVAGGVPAEKRAQLAAAATQAQTQREHDATQKRLDRENRTKNAGIMAGNRADAAERGDVTALRKEIKADPSISKYKKASAELSSLRELAKSDSGASDMALVFAFMKAMDPESVVRESEYAAAARAGRPDERMMGLVSRWWTGGPLSAGQRASFIKAAEAAQSGHKSAYENARKTYIYTAKKHEYDLAELGLDEDGGESKPGGRRLTMPDNTVWEEQSDGTARLVE